MTVGAELAEVLRDRNYDEAIALTRTALDDDITNLTDPVVKEWLALRFRNLFITSAARNPEALDKASHYSDFGTRMKSKVPLLGRDSRSDRQVIAESYLREHGREEWQIEMPEATTESLEHTTIIFVPGVGSGLLPAREFPTIFSRLENEYGWKILRVDVNPLASCATVAADIDRTVNQGLGFDAADEIVDPADAEIPENVMFIGYSKGTPDVMEYLVANPEMAKRTKALITWVGATRGSYLAPGTYDQIKDVDLPTFPDGVSRTTEAFLRLIAPFLRLNKRALRRSADFNLKAAVHALLPEVREEFLDEHSGDLNDLGVPILSLTGSTDITRVPTSQMQGLLALAEYDKNNDMQVTQYESTLNHIPMATHLARLHANHWDFSFEEWPREYRLTSPNLEHEFPKQDILIALVQLMIETGMID